MTSINCVYLLGRLGKDPEIRPSKRPGQNFMTFSVATTYKAPESNEETTVWHNCIVFDQEIINAMQHLGKGNQVCLQGMISYRSVEAKAGYKVPSATIVCKKVMPMTNPMNKGKPTMPPNAPSQAQPPNDDAFDDDMPF